MITFSYTCPRCAHEQEVQVTDIIPAHISGPPESCYPAEGGEIESGGCCEKCGFEFDEGKLVDKAEEIARNDVHDYPEPEE